MWSASIRWLLLLLSFWLLPALSSCAHQKFVSESYPRWGEEQQIDAITEDAPLIVRTLFPEKPEEASACVLLVHGMNEHIGRYAQVARYFATQFIVFGFDQYAHGLSNPVLHRADRALLAGAGAQDVGDAYLAQAALYDLEPLRHTLDRVLQQLLTLCDAKQPIFIVAHSLGGLVAASYLLQTRQRQDLMARIGGIVFLAPAFAVSEPPGWQGWIANPVIKMSFHAETRFLYPQDESLPAMVLNQLFSLLTVPLFDSVFEILSWPGLRNLFTPGSPAWVVEYLTDSEAERARVRADHWIVRRSLLRYVKGIEQEIISFRHRMKNFTLPYLLVYSEYDPITPSWGNKDFTQLTFRHHPDNEVMAFPHLPYHQHLFLSEPIRTEVLRKAADWMKRRLK